MGEDHSATFSWGKGQGPHKWAQCKGPWISAFPSCISLKTTQCYSLSPEHIHARFRRIPVLLQRLTMGPKAVGRWQGRGLSSPQLLGPSPGPSPLPAFLLTLSLRVPNLAWFLFHHPAYLLTSFRSPGHTEFSLQKYTEAVENLIHCLCLEITSCDGPI